MYAETYTKIFEFLNKLYGFSPKIIHTDFESAIIKAIETSTFFISKPLHSTCIFQFSKAIKKMINFGICNTKLNKKNLEILRNLISLFH